MPRPSTKVNIRNSLRFSSTSISKEQTGLSLFCHYLEKYKILNNFNNIKNKVTIFAPIDRSFKAFKKHFLKLSSNQKTRFLKSCLFKGEFNKKELLNKAEKEETIENLNGVSLIIKTNRKNDLYLSYGNNIALVTNYDIPTHNGYIHFTNAIIRYKEILKLNNKLHPPAAPWCYDNTLPKPQKICDLVSFVKFTSYKKTIGTSANIFYRLLRKHEIIDSIENNFTIFVPKKAKTGVLNKYFSLKILKINLSLTL